MRGQGRVLLMDDEETVREVAREMLRNIGYTVTLATDGETALQEYQRALDLGAPFDVVILDLTVPGGMGGKETIRKLRDIDPRVRAIVSSGYSSAPIMADFGDYGFCGVLKKPYNVADVGNTVQSVLRGPAL
jgi:CheY-like chemotaxis protein